MKKNTWEDYKEEDLNNLNNLCNDYKYCKIGFKFWV